MLLLAQLQGQMALLDVEPDDASTQEYGEHRELKPAPEGWYPWSASALLLFHAVPPVQ